MGEKLAALLGGHAQLRNKEYGFHPSGEGHGDVGKALAIAHHHLEAPEQGRRYVVGVAFELRGQEEEMLAVEGLAGEGVGGEDAAHTGDGGGAQATGDGDGALVGGGVALGGLQLGRGEQGVGSIEGHAGKWVIVLACAGRQGDGGPNVQGHPEAVEAGAQVCAACWNPDGYRRRRHLCRRTGPPEAGSRLRSGSS